MGYEKDGDTLRYRGEKPSNKAVEWQGYDEYAGIDNYKDVVLPKDTILIKLHRSSSGYFTTLDQYCEMLGVEKNEISGKNNTELIDFLKQKDASVRILSEGLQVGPYVPDASSTGDGFYRMGIEVYKLDENIEVAFGEHTFSNGEYGKGGFSQVYIPDFEGVYGQDGKFLDDKNKSNEKIGIYKIGDPILLSDTKIEKDKVNNIQKLHKQHVMKRNNFYYKNSRNNLINVLNKTKELPVRDYIESQIKKINKKIEIYNEKIVKSQAELKDLNSPTYDDISNYLSKKYEAYDKKIDFNQDKDMESKIKMISKNLSTKIENDIFGKRNINVDELYNAYKLNNFAEFQEKISTLDSNITKLEATIKDYEKSISKIDQQKAKEANESTIIKNSGFDETKKLYEKQIETRKDIITGMTDLKNENKINRDLTQEWLNKSIELSNLKKHLSIKNENDNKADIQPDVKQRLDEANKYFAQNKISSVGECEKKISDLKTEIEGIGKAVEISNLKIVERKAYIDYKIDSSNLGEYTKAKNNLNVAMNGKATKVKNVR